MVGAAVRGLSKILRKTGKKPVSRSKKYLEGLKKRPRGTPTKAGLVHKRNLLRGDEPATKKDTYLSRRATLAGVKGVPKPKSKNILLGTSALAGAAGYIAGKKGIEDRKSTKSKLKKSLEKHKKKTKEQKEKRKKR